MNEEWEPRGRIISRARAGALQDTLRQRGGERSRPQPELDYIERLLKQF